MMPIPSYPDRVVALCLTILQRYHENRRSHGSCDMMVAEIEVITAGLIALDYSSDDVDRCILTPMEQALSSRYGPEAGQRLNTDFLAAWTEAWPDPTAQTQTHRATVGAS